MNVKLYVIPVSHSAECARLMLDFKGIEYERINLLSGFHPIRLRMAGFTGRTVPAIRVNGLRIQGSQSISQVSRSVHSERPLFPTNSHLRQCVIDAEEWGAEVFQDVPRHLF